MSGGKIFRKFLIFLCLAALMLTGCTSAKTEEAAQQETDGKEENGEKKIQIGLTVDSFVIERWIRDRDVFVATARDLGAEVNVQDAGADAQEQISQIDYFIKKHMDVIVIIARDCGALSEAVERAHSSGIRVISYDRMVMTPIRICTSPLTTVWWERSWHSLWRKPFRTAERSL